MPGRTTRTRSGAITGNLRPADPFELIRWLARSQNDPRKALAELVQNSLDAAATRIQIVRARERGMTALHVIDDGSGVLPELSREEALAYIATHIGHSRKRNLTPEQRRELMLQGKYGIGLLGFWSVGKHFEMRSQVGGSEPWVLRLTEDEPRFSVDRLRGRLPLQGTWTEVVVRQLHRPAFVSLGARRIVDYLAAELRGQLLARPNTTITVHDRVARGRAPKLLDVQPVRYAGQPLPLPDMVDTAHGPLRVELYLLPEGAPEAGKVSVSCAGTVVYDDLCDFEIADFRCPPWSSGRLTGMLDFAGFEVAPGTRRGVVPNAAAAAFADAVRALEVLIQGLLAQEEARLASELEVDLLKKLQRVFRDLPRLAPVYDFFAVRGDGAGAATDRGESESPVAGAEVRGGGGTVAEGEGVYAESAATGGTVELFPPGPLASVEIVPASVRVARLAARSLRARARDAGGRLIGSDVEYLWSCDSEQSSIEGRDAEAMFRAGPDCETVRVWVVATQGERHTSAEATVEVVEEVAEPIPPAGIPQPEFVNEPTGDWRSRFSSGQWQVNAGHRDYQIASESARRKLRYLTALLAKEIILHSFPHPQHAAVLERMVEVLTIAERRLE